MTRASERRSRPVKSPRGGRHAKARGRILTIDRKKWLAMRGSWSAHLRIEQASCSGGGSSGGARGDKAHTDNLLAGEPTGTSDVINRHTGHRRTRRVVAGSGAPGKGERKGRRATATIAVAYS